MGEASFDDLIPLADVPATGDISIIWYGATLLSAAGAVHSGPEKPRRTETPADCKYI